MKGVDIDLDWRYVHKVGFESMRRLPPRSCGLLRAKKVQELTRQLEDLQKAQAQGAESPRAAAAAAGADREAALRAEVLRRLFFMVLLRSGTARLAILGTRVGELEVGGDGPDRAGQ